VRGGLPNVRKQDFVDQRPDSPSSKTTRVIAEADDGRATIDDVIQIAGVACGTFYNYFTDRNALLDAVWQGIGRDPFLGMQQACAEVEDPAARLFIMMRLILNRTAEDATWGWLVFAMPAIRCSRTPIPSTAAANIELAINCGVLRIDVLEIVGTLRRNVPRMRLAMANCRD
jgi:AcrR family transcriptional regulator